MPCFTRDLLNYRFIQLACASVLAAAAGPADAHGVAGARFFPATIATDDPFAADELALPTVSVLRHPEDGLQTTETGYEMEFSKSVFPGFAISFEDGYAHARSPGEPSVSGFDDLALTPILEVVRNDAHEFIASVAFSWEMGGTGTGHAGADSASSFVPRVQFGKGFGDLPSSLSWFRPLAITGTVGYAIPGHGEPHVFEWGGAVEYSLLYLQNNVRDVGLGPFLSRVTPVMEFSFSSPLGRNGDGTTGTINPGLIWSGQQVQVGAEAMLPLDRATGRNVGVIAQLHFYLDDILPRSLGRPLFE